MQWRTQRALAGWLSVILLIVSLRYGTAGCRGARLVNVERVRGVPPQFVTDVNRAPWPELTLLPGIGPAMAQRIVVSREQDGPFREPEDLLRVRGIGPKTLAAVRPYVICGTDN